MEGGLLRSTPVSQRQACVAAGYDCAWNMIRGSGNHLCGKIMLKLMILRALAPTDTNA